MIRITLIPGGVCFASIHDGIELGATCPHKPLAFAHELGHIKLGHCGAPSSTAYELAAWDFAVKRHPIDPQEHHFISTCLRGYGARLGDPAGDIDRFLALIAP